MRKGKITAASGSRKTAVSAPTAQSAQSSVTPEHRINMIAEAAYYLAEHRGFQGGDPQQDWLAAEAEIDRLLGGKLH